MKVIIIALHFNEARRICLQANWQFMGQNSPEVVLVNDPTAVDKVRGWSGGLMLITEGAQRAGGIVDVVMMALQQRIMVVKMDEIVDKDY